MEKRTKQNMFLIAFGVILFACVMKFQYVLGFLQSVLQLLLPLLFGGVLAFILSVPMGGFERLIQKLCGRMRRRPNTKTVNVISLFLTLFSIVLVLVLVCTIAIPQIVDSGKSIGLIVKAKWPEWAAILKSYNIDTAPITKWFENLEFEKILANILSGAGAAFDIFVGTATSTISVVVTGAIAFVVMLYILLSKEELIRQVKKLAYAYLKKEKADKIFSVAVMIRKIFAKFLSGQFVEAIILGVLIFIALTIFRMPYAGLIGMVTSVCAFIPYIGAFFSCSLGAFLIFISNPRQVIVYLIVYLVVQFVENQFIYPRVVGNSVGLSPLFTLVAAMLGGKMFGLPGMVFSIPIVAVIYTLLREHINNRLRNRDIHIE